MMDSLECDHSLSMHTLVLDCVVNCVVYSSSSLKEEDFVDIRYTTSTIDIVDYNLSSSLVVVRK